MRPISPIRRTNENGQAILLLVTGLSLVMILAVGWGMDAGRLYAQHQNAQAAADAGAQAGIMSMYDESTTIYGPSNTTFTCTSGSTLAPCYYVAKNGFATSNDTTTVTVKKTLPGVPNVYDSPSGPSVIVVQVQRNANLTLMRILGLGSTTISASAAAAIVLTSSPSPIVVTHPTLSSSLSVTGNGKIVICGGPSRGITVDSSSSSAFSVSGNGVIDLSNAGPLDTAGNCTSGTGADFATVGQGSPTPITSSCSGSGVICVGTGGHYVQPASSLTDPLLYLAEPNASGTLLTATTVSSGTALATGCATKCPNQHCNIYRPGDYEGISVSGNDGGYFYPGLYTMDPTDTSGFSVSGNGVLAMMPSACVTADPDTSFGMVVVNKGTGPFSITGNGNVILNGPPTTSAKYEGVLFWEGRTLSKGVASTIAGNGSITLTGTIYTNITVPTSTYYHTLSISGNGGSTTKIVGQVITNVLNISGNGAIEMDLNPAILPNQRQVAIVQ
jgi:hypothetical protein